MSRDIVDRFYKKGIFVESDGAIGCTLDDLPFCLLLKSNGTGLYATKDIALAEIKFSQYNVDKSIYIVDSSQALHFQQVTNSKKKLSVLLLLWVCGNQKSSPYGAIAVTLCRDTLPNSRTKKQFRSLELEHLL